LIRVKRYGLYQAKEDVESKGFETARLPYMKCRRLFQLHKAEHFRHVDELHAASDA
jgi:hypothetical protein